MDKTNDEKIKAFEKKGNIKAFVCGSCREIKEGAKKISLAVKKTPSKIKNLSPMERYIIGLPMIIVAPIGGPVGIGLGVTGAALMSEVLYEFGKDFYKDITRDVSGAEFKNDIKNAAKSIKKVPQIIKKGVDNKVTSLIKKGKETR